MPKYLVDFQAMAYTSVVVEAEDKDAAIEKAWDAAIFPYFPAGMNGDLGDWDADYDNVWEMED